MKVLFIGFLILSLLSECCESKKKEDFKSVSIAIKNIAKVLYDSSGEVTVKSYQKDEQTIQSLILDNAKNEGAPVRVIVEVDYRNFKRLPGRLRDPVSVLRSTFNSELRMRNSIIALQSFRSLQSKGFFFDFFDLKRANSYLTYVHAFDINIDLQEQKEFLRFMKDFYFIVEDEAFIRLKTIVWYQPGQCETPTLITINKFSKRENIWLNSQFTIKKFRNFYGCGIGGYLPVTVSELASMFIHEKMDEIFQSTRENADRKLFEIVAKSLNFTVEKDRRKVSFVSYLLSDRGKGVPFYFTQPHVFRSICFAIPVGQPFDAYEKLILPFDDDVWILILLTFLIAFFTIVVLRLFHPRIRNFIIGQNISTPALNVVMIFFGISQISLPGRNFARFLTMTFILYCMIIRTAWQGKSFEFMQKDMRKPEVKSIEEMIQNNFTFYVTYKMFEALAFTDFGQRARISQKSIYEIYNFTRFNLTDWNFKGAVQIIDEASRIEMVASNGSIFQRYLKERINLQMLSLGFRDDLAVEAFDEKLQQLVTGGFISHFEKDNIKSTNPKRYEHFHYRGPEVLSISLAIIAFMIEWAKTFLDYLIVKNLLRAFYQVMYSSSRRSRPIETKMKFPKIDSLQDECSQANILEQILEVPDVEDDSISAVFGGRVNGIEI